METNTAFCNKAIYEHGRVLRVLAGSKREAEDHLDMLRETYPHLMIDWHYVAGRAVFKFLTASEYEAQAPNTGADDG